MADVTQNKNPNTTIRDSNGRFVKKDQINLKASTPIRNANGQFVKTTKINVKTTLTKPDGTIVNPEFEKPLVAVSINNPFKRILYWLDQIRRHQTTTLAFKLSIPLIAIPIIIAAVFSLGRVYGINLQKEREASPTPKATSTPSPNPSAIPKIDPTVSRAGTLRIAVGNETKYLLALRNGTLVVLDIPTTIDLNKYKDKQVLVTGTLNSTTGILKVTDIAEVQIFNPTTVPESSSSSQTN